MSAEFNYRIVNVFAEERLAGNPLAVIEDARGMDDATMQALALQFNLSETAFLLPSANATCGVRFFFSKRPGSIEEDPGTGSACANLGGWMIAAKRPLPLVRTIYQGDRVGRPCRLRLSVDESGGVFVAGRVIELGRGTVTL